MKDTMACSTRLDYVPRSRDATSSFFPNVNKCSVTGLLNQALALCPSDGVDRALASPYHSKSFAPGTTLYACTTLFLFPFPFPLRLPPASPHHQIPTPTISMASTQA